MLPSYLTGIRCMGIDINKFYRKTINFYLIWNGKIIQNLKSIKDKSVF